MYNHSEMVSLHDLYKISQNYSHNYPNEEYPLKEISFRKMKSERKEIVKTILLKTFN